MTDETNGTTSEDLEDNGEHDAMRRVRPIPSWKKDGDGSQDIVELYRAELSAGIANLRAQCNTVSAAATASTSIFPVNFLMTGTYSGWIYLDSGGTAVETVIIHQVGNLWALCKRDGSCELCRHAEWWNNKRPGYEYKWRYGSSAKSLAIFAIDNSSANNPNIRKGVPAILLGPPALELKIKELIRQSSDEEVMRDFDPEAESPLWDIRKTKDLVEITRSRVVKARPSLPDTFPALKSFRGIDAPPTEDTIKEFKEKIDAAYSEYLKYSEPR